MLLGNGSLLHKLPLSLSGGAFGSTWLYFCKDETMLNYQFGGLSKTTSVPAGYGASGAIAPCITAGAMTSQYGAGSLLDGSADLAQGMSVAASGSMLDVLGSAALGAVIRMDANGQISITGSAGMFGVASMDALGGISIDGVAGLGGLFSISAEGALTIGGTATTHSLAFLVTTESAGEMTEQTIAAAVWSALAAQFNVEGTMGNKLNDAGGAADPWDDSRALTVAKFLALKD